MPIRDPRGADKQPARESNAQPTSESARSGFKLNFNSPVLKGAGVVVVVLLVIAFVAYQIIEPGRSAERANANYKPEYVTDDVQPEYVRLYPDTAPDVPIQDIFNDKNFALYTAGKGRTFALTVKSKKTTRLMYSYKFELPPLSAEDHTQIGERQRKDAIRAKQTDLETAIRKFAGGFPPTSWTLITFFDDSAVESVGWLTTLQTQFNRIFKVEERLADGDTVKLIFHKLTDSEFYRGSEISIKPGQYSRQIGDTISQRLEALTLPDEGRRRWVIAHPNQAGRTQSAISEGLFNSLRQDGMSDATEVLVVSDGLEHLLAKASKPAFSLEAAEPMATIMPLAAIANKDPKNEKAQADLKAAVMPVWDRLQESFAAPKCNGAKLHWVMPPRESKSNQMQAAVQNIWIPLWKEQGCDAGWLK